VRESSRGDPGDRLSEEHGTELFSVEAYALGMERAGIAIANAKNISVEK